MLVNFMNIVYLFLLGLIFCYLLYLNKSRKLKNYPPGPPGLPFFGNILQFGLEPHKAFMKMRRKYGDIVSIDFGCDKAIVLNNSKLIKQAFNDKAFAGRTRLAALLEKTDGKPRGVLSNDGPAWFEQRRFVIQSLRELGFRKNSIEEMIRLEIQELLENLSKNVGKSIILHGKFHVPAINPLWRIISGKRFSTDVPEPLEMLHGLESAFQEARNLGITLFYPWLRNFLPTAIAGKSRCVRDNLVKFHSSKLIKLHKKALQESSSSNFINAYLKKIAETTNVTSSFYADEGEKNLVSVMIDLIGSTGTEAVAQALTWVCLYLSIHEDVQDKLYAEVKNIVGVSKLPELADRLTMPYTQAVLMEVLRIRPPLPISTIHRVTEDTQFEGYDIPVDTLVVGNIYGSHHDETVWEDPEAFRPTRFLTSDGAKLMPHNSYIPFSYGQRICLGEKYANDVLFLFTTSLIQKFQIKPSPAHLKPNPSEYIKGVVLIPKQFYVVLKDRCENV